ncbi:MAG: carbohydrate porin [Bacteroidota bacterium]
MGSHLKHFVVSTACFSLAIAAAARSQDSASQEWNFHFQQTIVVQYHPDFTAKYSGQNSLDTSEPAQTSLTSTFFIGRTLWKNAELYINPELAGGNGLSGATGVAGFPNGETFRIGNPAPELTIARLLVNQRFDLSDTHSKVEDDENQLAESRATSYIDITGGKISMIDYFDKNRYSDDPRTKFLNWALMTNGAWDYPANTHGYTWGLVAELVTPLWSFRISTAMVPTEANKSVMDMNLTRAHSETIEIERDYGVGSHQGAIRLLGFRTMAHMGNYQQALELPAGDINIVDTRAYGRSKYGVGLNIEQGLSDNVGMLLRASWNDGHNETWMFTEIDQAVSTAFVFGGKEWNRDGDNFGIALLANGISADHRAYLKAGGYGFLIGDGTLNYAPEAIAETYYSLSLPTVHLQIAPDYQFILNPAYNKDRGPVHIMAARFHLEI